MKTKIGILGGGSWGSALGILLCNEGKKVDLWVRSQEQALEMVVEKTNKKYLKDVNIPDCLRVSNSLEEVIGGKDIIVLAIPTQNTRSVVERIKGLVSKDQIIVNVAKGIENNTMMRISEIVKEHLPDNPFVALSGPSHAEEVAISIPTTLVSASTNKIAAETVQDEFSTPTLRIYTNPDIVGVELGGALKNIIALGAGISDGLGFGDNTKAALMTRGIFEMAKLGVALGADPDTFSGLSGMGDLIVTCTSMHSRNRRAGILIGKGYSMEEAAQEVGMVVEGIKTTKSAYELAKKLNVDMPITREIYNVLYNGADVRQSVIKLMGREKKHEMEIIASKNADKW